MNIIIKIGYLFLFSMSIILFGCVDSGKSNIPGSNDSIQINENKTITNSLKPQFIDSARFFLIQNDGLALLKLRQPLTRIKELYTSYRIENTSENVYTIKRADSVFLVVWSKDSIRIAGFCIFSPLFATKEGIRTGMRIAEVLKRVGKVKIYFDEMEQEEYLQPEQYIGDEKGNYGGIRLFVEPDKKGAQLGKDSSGSAYPDLPLEKFSTDGKISRIEIYLWAD